MTRSHFIFLLFLFSGSFAGAQTFPKNYFEKTAWFCSNKDSALFRADTLKLIQHCNQGPAVQNKEYAEFEVKYLKYGYFAELGFNKQGKLKISFQNEALSLVPGGQWTWNYDPEKNVLSLYDNHRKCLAAFRPLSERPVKVESRFEAQKELLNSKELTMLRVK